MPDRGARTRADQLLVERGLAPTRSRAASLILAGQAWIGDRRIGKAGDLVRPDAPVSLRGQDHPWVSRGGLKLAHGLDRFAFSPEGRIGLDIGASTGGFTDVLLARGAARVHAVDVGHGQLAWRLRSDPRVVVHERTNARHLAPATLGEDGGRVGALVCDASFIGLRTVLPAPLALVGPGAFAVVLIKPQFEAGPADVPKGVVRDELVHRRVCDEIVGWWSALPGWRVLGVEPSPITGPEGNREFLLGAVSDAAPPG